MLCYIVVSFLWLQVGCRGEKLWFVKKSISRFNCENIVANNICN